MTDDLKDRSLGELVREMHMVGAGFMADYLRYKLNSTSDGPSVLGASRQAAQAKNRYMTVTQPYVDEINRREELYKGNFGIPDAFGA